MQFLFFVCTDRIFSSQGGETNGEPDLDTDHLPHRQERDEEVPALRQGSRLSAEATGTVLYL
jgi:hypothetical protein